MRLSRRDLVCLAAGGAALAASGGGAPPAFAAPAGRRAAVGIFLYGGNDGWNMVIPTGAGHAAYRAARGSVAIRASALSPLAGTGFALHPAMAALRPLWEEGALGLVLDAGAAAPSDHWEAQHRWPADGARSHGSLAAQLTTIADAIGSGRRGTFLAGQGGYDTHEDQVGADSATGRHADLLRELALGIAGFHRTMREGGLEWQVTLFTMSDFGRSMRGNAARGTDHGAGSNHLVIGGLPPRTILGAWPDPAACAAQPALTQQQYLRAILPA